jgi:hypothetical protein
MAEIDDERCLRDDPNVEQLEKMMMIIYIHPRQLRAGSPHEVMRCATIIRAITTIERVVS